MKENTAKHIRYFVRGLQITLPKILAIIGAVIATIGAICALISVVLSAYFVLSLLKGYEIKTLPTALYFVLVIGHVTVVLIAVTYIWSAGKEDLEEGKNATKESGAEKCDMEVRT